MNFQTKHDLASRSVHMVKRRRKALTRLSDLAINQKKSVKFDERWAGNDTGDLVTLATDLK